MNDLIFIYNSKLLKVRGRAVPAWKLVSRLRSAFFSLSYIFIQIQNFKISLQDPGTFIVFVR